MADGSTTLLYRFLGIDAGAGAQFERMAAKTTVLGEASKATSSKVASLAKGAALAGVVIGVASVKMASDYQRAMTLIQTQAGASKAEVASFSKSLLGMAGKVGKSPEELATSLYHVYSTGLRGAEALRAVKIAAEGAQIGNADLEETTNALTSTIASGIKGAGNYAAAMGKLNAIVGAGDMKLSDLNDALGSGILAAARVFNVSLTQVGAALAVFGDNNIRGADAATKLRMVIQDLAKPAANADQTLAQIGLTSDELRSKLENRGLTAALQDLKTHMDAAGITAGKVGPFIEQAFTKKAGVGLGILIEQMGRYNQKLVAVGEGGKKFGSDWAATTKTFAFSFDRMRAEVDSLLIQLGTKLLPVATDVVNWFGKNLPHAISTLGDVLGPVAHGFGDVLGMLSPVLSVLKDLAPALLAMWGAFKLYTIALAAGRAISSMFVTMRIKAMYATEGLAKSRAAVAGLGLAIGYMTRDASDGTKALGAMASTAIGAAQGFAVGGPLGAAIGGTIGLLGDLAGAFGLGSDSASAQAAEMAQNVDSLTAALQRDNLAVGGTTKAWIAHKIATSGVLALQDKLGVSYETITRAALGNKNALGEVQGAWNSLGHEQQWVLGGATKDLIGTLGDLGISLGRAKDKAWAENNVQVALGQAHRDGAAAALRTADAVSHLAAGSHTVADVQTHEKTVTDSLTMSLAKLRDFYIKTVNAMLGLKQSQLQFLDSLRAMKQAVDASNGSLADQSAKGRAAQEALLSAAQGAASMADGTNKSNKALVGNIESLRRQAIEAGASKASVDSLLRSLGLMPHQIRTQLHVETADAVRSIENFVNTPWKTYVQVITRGGTGDSGGRAPLETPPPGHGSARGLDPGVIIDALKALLRPAIDAVKSARQNLHSALGARSSAISSLSGNLTGDLSGMFGTGTDIAGDSIPVTANINKFLGGQRKTLEQFAKDLKWGAKHGLSGALLSEIAGLGAVQGDEVLQQFISGAASITAANRAEAAIHRFSRQAASTVEDRVYARQVAKDRAALKEQTQVLKDIRHELQHPNRTIGGRPTGSSVTVHVEGARNYNRHDIASIIKGIKQAERTAGKALL